MNDTIANPYAPPAHDRLEVAAAQDRRFFVVSPTKFMVMYLVTFGFYGLFWFYQQWAHVKRASKGDEWPVARALFSVFFTHSLFQEFDASLRRQALRFDWAPTGLATGVVLLTVLTNVLGRVDGNWTLWVTIACIPVLALLLQKAQRAANAACGDATGAANANFTVGNIVWIVFGGLFWLLVMAGLLLPDA